LLGRWKNYDELEDSISVDELIVTIQALREKDERDKKFNAALQGINLEESIAPDITTLSGNAAAKTGFGIGAGVGHEIMGL